MKPRRNPETQKPGSASYAGSKSNHNLLLSPNTAARSQTNPHYQSHPSRNVPNPHTKEKVQVMSKDPDDIENRLCAHVLSVRSSYSIAYTPESSSTISSAVAYVVHASQVESIVS